MVFRWAKKNHFAFTFGLAIALLQIEDLMMQQQVESYRLALRDWEDQQQRYRSALQARSQAAAAAAAAAAALAAAGSEEEVAAVTAAATAQQQQQQQQQQQAGTQRAS